MILLCRRSLPIFGRRCPAALASAHHLLHSFPHFRRNDIQRLGNKNVVRGCSSCDYVISGLNIGHGDTVASFAQRGIFVQFHNLRDIIHSQHGNSRWIQTFHFAHHKVFSLCSRHSSRTARTSASCKSRGHGRDHHGRSSRRICLCLIGPTDHVVAYFKIRKLGSLAFFSEFG